MKLIATAASILLALSIASPSFAAGKGGGIKCAQEKGNNGWGNGGDPTNNGSSKGATSETKLNSNLR
jgi:hypothetical protein